MTGTASTTHTPWGSVVPAGLSDAARAEIERIIGRPSSPPDAEAAHA